MVSPWGKWGAGLVADDASAAALPRRCTRQNWPWLIDVVQAYASVAVYFEGARDIALDAVIAHVRSLPTAPNLLLQKCIYRIPVCYERQLDLDPCRHTGLGSAIIRGHAATPYVVYAIGFCPGFPYLGYLPEEIANVPRFPSPCLRVPAGSVGLMAGKRAFTPRPGGWNIIGQTPLELVNVADNYFPLRTGDEVRFERIDEAQFARLTGHRL